MTINNSNGSTEDVVEDAVEIAVVVVDGCVEEVLIIVEDSVA